MPQKEKTCIKSLKFKRTFEQNGDVYIQYFLFFLNIIYTVLSVNEYTPFEK